MTHEELIQMRQDVNALSQSMRLLTTALSERSAADQKALEETTLHIASLVACLIAHGVLKEGDMLTALREFRELGIDGLAKMVGAPINGASHS